MAKLSLNLRYPSIGCNIGKIWHCQIHMKNIFHHFSLYFECQRLDDTFVQAATCAPWVLKRTSGQLLCTLEACLRFWGERSHDRQQQRHQWPWPWLCEILWIFDLSYFELSLVAFFASAVAQSIRKRCRHAGSSNLLGTGSSGWLAVVGWLGFWVWNQRKGTGDPQSPSSNLFVDSQTRHPRSSNIRRFRHLFKMFKHMHRSTIPLTAFCFLISFPSMG